MKALILVDIQNDFCPAGALPVTGGDEVVPVANRVQARFDLVVATQDWHPPDHRSFAANHRGCEIGDIVDLDGLEQMLWPVHCVQGSKGAAFHPDLDTRRVEAIFRKGMDPSIDSYSGFFDNGHRKATGMGDYLKGRGAHELYVMGLATEYCVRYTALDALDLGFSTYLIEDGCRGVDLMHNDVKRALAAMKQSGISVIRSEELYS